MEKRGRQEVDTDSRGDGDLSLTVWLEATRLGAFETQLRGFGATDVSDLDLLTDEELKEVHHVFIYY